MTYALGKAPYRRPDRHVMFVVTFRDGTRDFLRVPPEVAAVGGIAAIRFAAGEQRDGRFRSGEIDRLIRVR
jgi:hypothetical protein